MASGMRSWHALSHPLPYMYKGVSKIFGQTARVRFSHQNKENIYMPVNECFWS